MRKYYILSLILIFAAISLSLIPLANADATVVGENQGQTTISVLPTDEVQLDINSTSAITPAETWFCFTMIKGGVQQPIYFVTSQGTIVPFSQVTDFNTVTYNFGSGPYSTIGTLTMQSLGLNPGDKLIYGYAVSSSDISQVQLPNTVVINVQSSGNYSVSGTITFNGAALPGVNVTLSGTTNNTTTDSNGEYTFSGLGNGSYVISASMNGYSFTPSSQTMQVNGTDVSGVTFSATKSTLSIGAMSLMEKISAGFQFSLAIKSDGTLWAWGLNDSGQLGDGGTTTVSNVPEQIGSDTNWVAVSASNSAPSYSIALKSDGTLWAWGDNAYGELGDGTTTSTNVPEQIGTATDWVAVSTGGSNFTLALKSDGTLWGWGNSEYGQLALESYDIHTSPQQIGTDTNWAAVSAGYDFVMALKSDGTLWAWGNNEFGQFGDGTTTPIISNVPELISTTAKWKAVSAGDDFVVALKPDGTLWAWGRNTFGQLGDGTTTNSDVPVQIGTATNWVAVSADNYSVIALRSDGTLWTWGDNTFGQLGVGPGNISDVPEQIGNSTNWIAVSEGDSHSMGIKSDGTLWTSGFDGTITGGQLFVQIGTDTNW